MTLPKGYERPMGMILSLRPKGLTRMLVDQRLLKIPCHEILNILRPGLKMMLSSANENHEEPKAIKAAEEIKKTT